MAFGLAVSLWTFPAAAEDGAPSAERAAKLERAECRRDAARRALALGASVVPGVVLHGAGHYVLCERETARRLLLIEGAGVATAAGSGVGLFLTGASRYVVAPLALGAIGGFGVFGLTLLADIYGVAAPRAKTGDPPASPPRLVIQAGLRAVRDRQFDAALYASQGFRLEIEGSFVQPRFETALDAHIWRHAVTLGHRVVGARAGERARSGSGFDLGLTLADHAYADDGFAMTTLDLFAAGRQDLDLIGPTLHGAFVDGLVGYARQWTRFDGLPGDATDELLARFAFGMYLGRSPGISGETFVAYDHRRDTLAGGLLLPGIPAGYAGFIEQRTELYFGPRFGTALELAYGSAWIGSAYFLVRFGTEDH